MPSSGEERIDENITKAFDLLNSDDIKDKLRAVKTLNKLCSSFTERFWANHRFKVRDVAHQLDDPDPEVRGFAAGVLGIIGQTNPFYGNSALRLFSRYKLIDDNAPTHFKNGRKKFATVGDVVKWAKPALIHSLGPAYIDGGQRRIAPEFIPRGYCTRCGSPWPKDLNVCNSCGHRIGYRYIKTMILMSKKDKGICGYCGSEAVREDYACPSCNGIFSAGWECQRDACEYCSLLLDRKWDYCPKCGQHIEHLALWYCDPHGQPGKISWVDVLLGADPPTFFDFD